MPQELPALIEKRVLESEKLIRAFGVDPAVFLECTLNALLTTPQLEQCSAISIDKAVLKCAQLGLIPDGREAAIVPFRKEAGLIPMIEGRIKMARQATPRLQLRPRAVYNGEEFEYEEGLRLHLVHRPSPDPGVRVDDNFLATYSVASVGDDVLAFELLFVAEINRYRARSAAYKSGKQDTPWRTDYVEMAKKSSLGQVLKRLPRRSGAFLSQSDDDVERIIGAEAGDFGVQVDEAPKAIEQGEKEPTVDEALGGKEPEPEPVPASGRKASGGGRRSAGAAQARQEPKREEEPPPPTDPPAEKKGGKGDLFAG